jgi:Gpi18-like mannosyltransferase
LAASDRWAGRSAGLLATTLYVFCPVVWYGSATCGQIDSIGALLLLAAAVLQNGTPMPGYSLSRAR